VRSPWRPFSQPRRAHTARHRKTLLKRPTFVHFFKQRWVLADFESKTDWMNHSRTGVKSDVQLGRNVSRGSGIWMKPELWWGPNEAVNGI